VGNRNPKFGVLYTSETGSIFHCPKKAIFHSSTMVHSLLLLVNQPLGVLPAACGLVAIDIGRRITLRYSRGGWLSVFNSTCGFDG